ncbi:MAG: outer membrane protein transport protein [Nitrospiraceae bacterium]|nr:MAG: outer membrane protein transport protein [Nitrospiraceae bacterium]
MRKFLLCTMAVLAVFSFAASSDATNGDNLIANGPISRSMGGVGIALPQDAISAVFSNPAAMCFGPYCPGSEFNFAGTLFMPDVSAKIIIDGLVIKDDADDKIYPIPAIGLSVPITNTFPLWRFGIAAYGVSGLGVDYRDTAIDQPTFYDFGPMGQFPLVAGEYTDLRIMKFAPAIAYQPNERFSVGLAVHIDYATLDLRSGTSEGYALGVQLGAMFKATDSITLGATYTSPQETDHDNVTDFDGDGTADDLTLEAPQQVGVGVAFEPIAGTLLVEGNVKWINWKDSDGYDDFDWDDQWVFAIGVQYKPTDKLALRAGYNYAENPVEEHNGFVGSNMTSVQGKMLPEYYYETFRIIGFPAIVEHHLTLGIGYEFSNRFSLHAGYVHAFEETISETGTNMAGQPTTLESTLSENSLEFGLTWRF